MGLSSYQTEKLRQHYGSAYITHALCDLRVNKDNSPVLQLIGANSWRLARTQVQRHLRRKANDLIGNLTPQHESLMIDVANGGLTMNLDQLKPASDVLSKGNQDDVSALAKAWRLVANTSSIMEAVNSMVTLFVTASDGFWTLLTKHANVGMTNLQEQFQVDWQTMVRQYGERAWSAIKYLYKTLSQALTVLVDGLNVICDSVANFICQTLQSMSKFNGTAIAREIVRQAFYVLFFIFQVGKEIMERGKQSEKELKEHLIQRTLALIPGLRTVFEGATFLRTLFSNAIDWLKTTTLGQLFIQIGKNIESLFSTVIGFIVETIKHAALAIWKLLPACLSYGLEFIADSILTLVRYIQSFFPDADNDPFKIQEEMVQHMKTCEKYSNNDALDPQTQNVAKESAQLTKTFVAKCYGNNTTKLSSSSSAAHINATIMSHYIVGNNVLETNPELIDELSMQHTGYGFIAFQELLQMIIENQTSAMLLIMRNMHKIEESEKWQPPSSSTATATGLRRRRPSPSKDVDMLIGGKIKELERQIREKEKSEEYRRITRQIKDTLAQYKTENPQFQDLNNRVLAELEERRDQELGISDLKLDMEVEFKNSAEIRRKKNIASLITGLIIFAALGTLAIVYLNMRQKEEAKQFNRNMEQDTAFEKSLKEVAEFSPLQGYLINRFKKHSEEVGLRGINERQRYQEFLATVIYPEWGLLLDPKQLPDDKNFNLLYDAIAKEMYKNADKAKIELEGIEADKNSIVTMGMNHVFALFTSNKPKAELEAIVSIKDTKSITTVFTNGIQTWERLVDNGFEPAIFNQGIAGYDRRIRERGTSELKSIAKPNGKSILASHMFEILMAYKHEIYVWQDMEYNVKRYVESQVTTKLTAFAWAAWGSVGETIGQVHDKLANWAEASGILGIVPENVIDPQWYINAASSGQKSQLVLNFAALSVATSVMGHILYSIVYLIWVSIFTILDAIMGGEDTDRVGTIWWWTAINNMRKLSIVLGANVIGLAQQVFLSRIFALAGLAYVLAFINPLGWIKTLLSLPGNALSYFAAKRTISRERENETAVTNIWKQIIGEPPTPGSESLGNVHQDTQTFAYQILGGNKPEEPMTYSYDPNLFIEIYNDSFYRQWEEAKRYEPGLLAEDFARRHGLRK